MNPQLSQNEKFNLIPTPLQITREMSIKLEGKQVETATVENTVGDSEKENKQN